MFGSVLLFFSYLSNKLYSEIISEINALNGKSLYIPNSDIPVCWQHTRIVT